jgi:hypothetical protein
VSNEKPKPGIDLIKLFGIEHLATLKTLAEESAKEVERKTPNDAALDIRQLLDEISIRVVSRDIDGCIKCLNAIQLRVDFMQKVAKEIKRASGR